MLTTANSGKYLTKRWNEMRERALVDRYQFTDDELAWLEVGADEGIVSPNNPETFAIQTQPIDPFTESRTIDMRKAYKRE